ncbi:MAG: response regulator [Chitinispirillaceae bacterium]|nr:response regulator [Chitinispirillaceae bacterium]
MAEPRQETKSAFIGLTSSEIRSTLTTITGLHNLLQETSLTAEQKRYVTSVQNATGTLLSLVNDLTDFSLIEAGEFTLDSMQFDLRTAIEEAMEAIAGKTTDRNGEMHTLIHASVPEMAYGDPARLRRIITTLVETALSFSPSGDIVLSVKTIEEDGDRSIVRFDLNEFGVGLTGEQLETLLQPFSRPDEVSSWKYGRTGLSLALAKRLAQRMDGQIGLSNAGGKGSTFWFSAALKKCPSRMVAEENNRQSLEGMNVLIADPSPSGRSIMIRYLTTAGCTCREYPDGETVLEELDTSGDTGSWDVLVLAMQEVGESGFRLVARLKEHPVLGGKPLVLVTAIGQRGEARKMKDLGVTAYLTRPLKQSELIDCMQIIRREQAGGDAVATDKRQLITRHTLAESNTGRKLRILVADDNTANRKKIKKMLDKAGYGCDIAENGVDAVNSFGKKVYDLVLMDCEMPIMNGYDAVRRIRKEEHLRGGGMHVPVCGMVAGGGGDEAERRCREAGMDTTIIKPLHEDVLIRLVEERDHASPAVSDQRG